MKVDFKKNTVLALAGVFILIIAAVSVYAYNTGVLAGDPKISEEEAKAIAEEYTNGTAISVELEKEGMSMVYEVVVENATGTWEVEIDADSGEVLEVEEDDGDNDDEDDDDDDDDNRSAESDDDEEIENEHEFEGEEEGEH